MSDKPTTVIVDCSPDVGVNREAVEAARKAAVERMVAGDVEGAMSEAKRAADLAKMPSRVTRRELEPDEIKALESLRAQADADENLHWRTRRDALLAACDWTMIEDAPISPQKKTVWRKYRQALRDSKPGDEFPKTP